MSGKFTEFGIDPDAGPTQELTCELVPATSWGDKLRKEQYRRAGYHCEICGGKGRRHPVECHELWAYNDDKHIQTLTGLIALCPSCHQVKHLGFAFVRGKEQQAIRHLMRVNGWDAQQTGSYIQSVFDQHERRSRRPWTLDLEWLRTVGVNPPT